MAKNTKKPALNITLLAAIAKATAEGGFMYVTAAEGMPLAEAGYIEVNKAMVDPSDASKAAARSTEAGVAYLVANSAGASAPVAATPSPYTIITNAVLPASKRGNKGGGAPTQYPFDALEVGGSFFVPVSEKHPDPVKKLGSTVSSANARYSAPTGEKQTVSRTKRGPGNKAVKDAAGNNVKEDVTVDVKKATRKFTIRPVKAGEKYGEWTAPADGALIGRIPV